VNRKIGAEQHKKAQLDTEIAQTERELESAKDQTERAAKARRRVGVAREAEEICGKLLEVRTEQTRAELDDRLKSVFGDMCFRPYVPALTEDFRLTLSDMTLDEIPVATSTGEGQILALSFVGVMAELARTRYEESQRKQDGAALLSFHGGEFPLALDAVFGSLDDTYQHEVAAALPKLAPQIVVLVTRGSAVDPIREHLWPRVGKTAVCTLYTSAENAEDTTVETLTGEVPYRVAITENRDRSEIVEF
jgi:DNA sulfur modification protein DndD